MEEYNKSKKHLLTFCDANKLCFKKGIRNKCATILAGYALWKEISYEDYYSACLHKIGYKKEYILTGDLSDTLKMFTTTWDFAETNNYGENWEERFGDIYEIIPD